MSLSKKMLAFLAAALGCVQFVYAAKVDAYVGSISVNGDGKIYVQTPIHTSTYDGSKLVTVKSGDDVRTPGLIVANPNGPGYWVLATMLRVNSNGDSVEFKSIGQLIAHDGAPEICPNGKVSDCSGWSDKKGKQLMSASAAPNGTGMWVVDMGGHVWTIGTAKPYGDLATGKDRLGSGQYPIAILGTPSGKGYYIIVSDGGVYTFGDATFYGAFGPAPKGSGGYYTGAALSVDASGNVSGYWALTKDGGIHTKGGAPFLGSGGGLNQNANSMAALPHGQGYVWVDMPGNRLVDGDRLVKVYQGKAAAQ
jgi:hypothetical protein